MRFTQSPNSPVRLELCRGATPQGCPRALWRDDSLAAALEQVSQTLGWPEYLLALTKGAVPRHLAFAVSVCGCANGCSRPHIADLGLIPARAPHWDAAACDRCLACLGACREQALAMDQPGDEPGLSFDRDRCLRCGDCLAVCPTGALYAKAQGYRILIGGKLGRRPRLARELSSLISPAAAGEALRPCLELMIGRTDQRMRFAEAIDAAGPEFLAELEALGS